MKKKAHQEIANVIEMHRAKPMVSSLKIAELFERRHDNVLRSIKTVLIEGRGLLIREETSLDIQGKERPVFWLDERQALILMPFIGGRNAIAGQEKLVDAYLYYRDNFKDPPRKGIIQAKRDAHKEVMDALVEFREDQGKETGKVQFMSESKLMNWAVTGKFAAIDESSLSNEDVQLLEKVRKQNAAMLALSMAYDERKPKLLAYAMKQRTRMIAKCQT